MWLKRSICLVTIPFALVSAADRKTETKPEPKACAAAKPKPEPKLKPGYVRTPFGIVKLDENAKPAEKVEAPVDVKVTEDGDTLRFERQGPFGSMKWARKKTELTEMEQAVWEREKARKAAEPEKNRE